MTGPSSPVGCRRTRSASMTVHVLPDFGDRETPRRSLQQANVESLASRSGIDGQQTRFQDAQGTGRLGVAAVLDLGEMGLPKMIVDADAAVLKGDLDSGSRELSTLIGRPTTTLAVAVRCGALPL